MDLSSLNASQREAVTTTEGIIRVIAGAGSGKTRALTHRFMYLVSDLGIMPGRIMCVTFTNKAANEMRERIHLLTGDDDTGYINTFHGFCVSVLQEESHAVQYPKSFLVLDNSDIDAMLQIIYEERGLTLQEMSFSAARDMIEIRKLFKESEYYKDMINLSLEALHEKYREADNVDDIIFYGYLYQEKKCFGLDYNDLLKYTLYIFQENEDIRLKWQKRLEYIMIDEFQDIDGIQYELMKVLCGYHRNLFVVGDPDQTIYSWRGADSRYLISLDREYPDAKTIMMMENYRSSPEIIDAANSLIDKNRERIRKSLIPTLPSSFPVLAHYALSQEKEAEWIASQIQDLSKTGTAFGDIAILYRAHHVTRALETALIGKKIPYVIYSGVQFYSRKEIKDALSYLRMIAFKDDLSLRRIINIPKRNIGRRRMAALDEYAGRKGMTLYDALKEMADDDIFRNTGAKDFIALIDDFSTCYESMSVSDVLSAILDRSGYEAMLRTEGGQDRLDNLAELKQSIYEYETSCGEEVTLTHYMSHIALFTNADTSESKDSVKLMTVHAAKGLEFPYVFISALSEGIFPSRKIRTREGMEEERRLCFVALTRAEKALFLSASSGRNFDGTYRYPSRFLLDIAPEYITFVPPLSDSLVRKAKACISENDKALNGEYSGYGKGTRVRHSVFGNGTVLDSDNENKANLVQFDNISTPRLISAKITMEVLDD